MTFPSDLDLTRLAAVPQHVKDKYLAMIMTPSPLSDEDHERMLDLGEQIRSALTPPPLRTRAEVDAEIATMVRIAYGAGSVELTSGAVRMTSQIEHLCAEPVRGDDPPQPERMTEAGWLVRCARGGEAVLYANDLRRHPPKTHLVCCGRRGGSGE